MTDREDESWRDEQRLPLAELDAAMATWDIDGQQDDVTGNDAGAESAFGHGPAARDDDGDQPAADQRHRPSTTGRTGPH